MIHGILTQRDNKKGVTHWRSGQEKILSNRKKQKMENNVFTDFWHLSSNDHVNIKVPNIYWCAKIIAINQTLQGWTFLWYGGDVQSIYAINSVRLITTFYLNISVFWRSMEQLKELEVNHHLCKIRGGWYHFHIYNDLIMRGGTKDEADVGIVNDFFYSYLFLERINRGRKQPLVSLSISL